jgi:hypothetical protein
MRAVLTAGPAPAGQFGVGVAHQCIVACAARALAVPGYLLVGRGRQDARERVPEPLDQWHGQTAAAS